jgi:hypothetical protein
MAYSYHNSDIQLSLGSLNIHAGWSKESVKPKDSICYKLITAFMVNGCCLTLTPGLLLMTAYLKCLYLPSVCGCCFLHLQHEGAIVW